MSENGNAGGRKKEGALEPAVAVTLGSLVNYQTDSVVSRTLASGSGGTLTLFAFDAGQELSEHTSPYQAFVQILDGEVLLTVGGKPVRTAAGSTVLMPADVPHAVKAEKRFKMLLTLVRENGNGGS